jgi:PAS domain S-box-containing protein
MNRLKVLLVSPSPEVCATISASLSSIGCETFSLQHPSQEFHVQRIGAVIVDLALSRPQERLAAIASHVSAPHAPVLFVSHRSDPELIVETMRAGAADFIPLSEIDRLPAALRNALDRATHTLESTALTSDFQQHLPAQRSELLAQFKTVIDRMPIGCILNDADFRFTYWNPAAERIFGFKLEEVKGKHPFGTITPVEAEPVVGKLFRRLAEGDLTANGVSTNQTKDGRKIFCEWNNSPLRGPNGCFTGILSMCQDVTARIQAEEAVQESEARFRQLAENLQECFWLSAVNKKEFIYVSPAFDKIWGFSRDRLFTSPEAWLESVHPDDLDRVKQATIEKQIPGTFNEEYRILRADGQVRCVRERAFPIRDAEGHIYRMAGLAEDVTRQKELERQFLQAQKMESVGRLAGGVAHDFGNMLTAISSFSRLALDSIPPESPAHGDLEQVLKAADRATSVAKQLLTFARRTHVQPSSLNLNALLLNLEKMLRRLVRENVVLKFETAANLWQVMADPTQMEQVFINLVVNAVDALPNGGSLTIKTANLWAAAPHLISHIRIPAGEYALLQFQDTGDGMTEQIQSQVFEPFFTTKEPGKGTGLGLATVYGIVQQSSGFIDVASKPGVGTTFTIALKRHP